MLPAQPNQSLIDGLACLQAVASAGGPVGSRELGRQLGLDSTRANRLLRTLGHLGFVRQDEKRKYLVGPSIHVLAAQALFASGILRRALGPLGRLGRLKKIIALGVLWRDQVAYLYHALPGMDVGEALGRVGLYPATRSGIGLPLLAFRDPSELRAVYGEGRDIPGYGQDFKRLLADLERTRRQGYAYVAQDAAKGLYSLGVTVGQSPHAAIALSGKIPRGAISRLLGPLRDAAMLIDEQRKDTDRAA